MSFINYILQWFEGPGDRAEMLHGTSKSLITKIAGLLCAYLFAFAVARVFGAEAWGEFSLALSVIIPGSILGTLGLDTALLKLTAGSGNREKISVLYLKSFLLISIASVVMAVICYFLADWLAVSVFGNPNLSSAFKLSALAIFPFSLLNLNASTLQGFKKIGRFVFLRFVSHHLFGLIFFLIFLIYIQAGQVVLIAYVCGLFVAAILSSYWLYKEKIIIIGSIISSSDKDQNTKMLLRLSIPLLFAGALVFIKGWTDTIMIGIFLSEFDVGIYNISLKLSGILFIVITSVNAIAAPKFSESYSNSDPEHLAEIVQFSTKLIFLLTLPLFLLLVIFPEPILGIFGEEFKAGKYALILLCTGNMIYAIAGTVGYLMQMTGSQFAYQNITLAIAIAGIILNYLLIPIYGIEGAALATCIGMIIWNGACVIFVNYKYGIKPYYRPFLHRRKKM